MLGPGHEQQLLHASRIHQQFRKPALTPKPITTDLSLAQACTECAARRRSRYQVQPAGSGWSKTMYEQPPCMCTMLEEMPRICWSALTGGGTRWQAWIRKQGQDKLISVCSMLQAPRCTSRRYCKVL